MAGPPPPPPPPPGANGNFRNGREIKHPLSAIVIFMNVTNTITHLLLGVVAFSAIMYANLFTMSSSYKQHIYLCVIGYIILMSQAILSLNPHTGWANSFKYQDKKTIHWVMQIVGSILAIAGSITRMLGVQNNFEHAHGTVGIVAMLLTIISLIGGLGNLLFGYRFGKFTKILHACCGSLTIIMAFICLCLAFHNYYRIQLIGGDVNANLLISLTVISLLGILMYPFMNIFKKITA